MTEIKHSVVLDQDEKINLELVYDGSGAKVYMRSLSTAIKSLHTGELDREYNNDGKTPLYAMILAALTNIGLDLLFVLVFHWGIAGAAAATVVAQVCSALYCLNAVRKIDILRFEKGLFDFIQTKYPEIPESIKTEKVITEETESLLIKAISEFKTEF